MGNNLVAGMGEKYKKVVDALLVKPEHQGTRKVLTLIS